MTDATEETDVGRSDGRWFNRLSTLIGLLTVGVVLFLPMVALVFLRTLLDTLQLYDKTALKVSGSAVGIGVILRATARRLLRTGARNVMRTTVGTFTRTTMRALTRRVVRIAVRSASLVAQKVFFVKAVEYTQTTEIRETTQPTHTIDSSQPKDFQQPPEAKQIHSPANSFVAILLGFVALYFSMLGILYILSWNEFPGNEYLPHMGTTLAINPAVPTTAIPAAAMNSPDIAPKAKFSSKFRQISTGVTGEPFSKSLEQRSNAKFHSVYLLALFGSLPILFYALFVSVSAWRNDIKVQFQTGIDGLLLQAYFTGGGSFLPLTTDVHYEGSPRKRAIVSATALIGLFLIHLLLLFPAYWFDSYLYRYASGMFLLYCFIYAFPIRPLDGHSLWNWSGWLWLLFFLPIFLSFMLNIPGSFNAIL